MRILARTYFLGLFGIAALSVAAAQVAGGSFDLSVTIGGKPKAKHAIVRSGTVPKLLRLRYTCGAAEISVMRAGYRHIERLDCVGGIYRYGAMRKGRRAIVSVAAATGRIVAVRRRGG
jgi:hypothetical protein